MARLRGPVAPPELHPCDQRAAAKEAQRVWGKSGIERRYTALMAIGAELMARAEELATRFDILSRGVITASITRKQLKKSNLLTFYKQAMAG